jgi:hypothetical protein
MAEYVQSDIQYVEPGETIPGLFNLKGEESMGARVTVLIDGVPQVYDFGSKEAAIKWADEHYLEYEQIEIKFFHPKDIRQGRHLYETA